MAFEIISFKLPYLLYIKNMEAGAAPLLKGSWVLIVMVSEVHGRRWFTRERQEIHVV